MFASFFPRPLVLTVSAALWGAFAVSFWYTFGSQTGELVGFHLQASGTKTVGAAAFWSAQFLWFYLYFVVAVALFASTWMLLSPHPWSRWSILGSALILFTSYFRLASRSTTGTGHFTISSRRRFRKPNPSHCFNSTSSLQLLPKSPSLP